LFSAWAQVFASGATNAATAELMGPVARKGAWFSEDSRSIDLFNMLLSTTVTMSANATAIPRKNAWLPIKDIK